MANRISRPEGSLTTTTLILCGGRGVRAYPATRELPKPLMEIADREVLRHVMDIYAQQGFKRFVLAAGFKAAMVDRFARTLPSDWNVEVIDTGEATDKADRVALCRDQLTETFFLTYCDGLGNVDLDALFAFHRKHGRAATVTVVPLPSQYGTITYSADGQVIEFLEKPLLQDHWINAGFFVMERRAFDHWVGPDLEGDVLPALARAGELSAYEHHGFWKSMDTYKDSQDLDGIARRAAGEEGGPPWLNLQKPVS